MLEIELLGNQESTVDLRLDEGQTLHFQLSDNGLLASVLNDDGVFGVKPECMTYFKGIKSVEVLKAFLANAFVKVTQFDNGDYDIKLHQKAKGGMKKQDQFSFSGETKLNNQVKVGYGADALVGKNFVIGEVFGGIDATLIDAPVNSLGAGASAKFNSNAPKVFNQYDLQLTSGITRDTQIFGKIFGKLNFDRNAAKFGGDTFSGYGAEVSKNITPNCEAFVKAYVDRNADLALIRSRTILGSEVNGIFSSKNL